MSLFKCVRVNGVKPTYVLNPFIALHQQTGNQTALDYITNLLADWVTYHQADGADNPYQWYDMAAGLRAVNMAYAVDQGLRAPKPDIDRLLLLVSSLVEHAERLSDPNELARNNHAFFQLIGLMSICKALPTLKKCKTYGRYANDHMSRLIKNQFTDEGIQREHSPYYHHYSLRIAKRAIATGWFNLTSEATKRLALAEKNIPWFFHPDGSMAMIGDTNRRGFKATHGTSRIEQSTQLKLFRNSGYAILRNAWRQLEPNQHFNLLFWAGEEQPNQGPAHSYGHSHADNFSFEWFDRGYPILMDSGKYTYNPGLWRDFFVSTRAHNTVEIDAQDFDNSVEPQERANQKYLPKFQEIRPEDGLFQVSAEINHKTFGVNHRRHLIAYPGEWLLVIDKLRGSREHKFTQWFHFHETWKLRHTGAPYVLENNTTSSLAITSLHPDVELSTLAYGDTAPRTQGWISPQYQQKIPRQSVGYHRTASVAQFVTLLSWGIPDPVSAKLEFNDDLFEVIWTTDGKAQGVRLGPKELKRFDSRSRKQE